VLALGLLLPHLAAARNLALLVGVADYDEPKIRALSGPRNDVILLWRHLSRHGFDAADITVLAEGLPRAADVPHPRAEPTRAAIMDGLARLAERAGSGDLVLFHFSGHGTTQPEAALAPVDGVVPEAGGRDQVLLPKDAGLYDPAARTIRNAIIDNELGAALDRIRAKGATVFVVVDACHAGTVTRSADVARGVDAATLGAPQLAAGAVMPVPSLRAPVRAPQRGGMLRSAGVSAPAETGALVAFFAVDSWTPAIERVYPSPAPGLVEKPGGDGVAQAAFGVFSWHLLRALERGQAATFRDLARMVSLDMAAAAQLAHAPLPVFEGDLDRGLPGAAAGGPRRFATRREGGELVIEAGALQGFDEGAEIALFDGPLAGAQLLGRVRLPGAGASENRVPLVGLPADAAASGGSLWAQMERPGVAFRFRVANVAAPEAAQTVAVALAPGEGTPAMGVDLVAPEQPADLRLHLADGRLWLVPEGGRLVQDPRAYGRSFSIPAGAEPDQLRNAVWAFARAANLVRLASVADMGAGTASGEVEISLDLIRETDPSRLADPQRACTQAAQPSAPLPVDSGMAAALAHCDAARLTIANRSERDIDLGIFFLDPLGGIDVPVRGWRQNGCIATLPARASAPLVLRTTLRTWGKDGPSQTGLHRILVFALPRAGGIPPSLCHLLQRDVATASAGTLRAGTGQRGFLDLLGRAALVVPGLRAANPFEAEDGAAGSVVVRQFSLDLLPPEASR